MLVAQSCPNLFDLWTVAHQAPMSMEFSRQEYWSRLPFPSPGDLPDPGIEPACLMSHLHWQAGSLPLAPSGKPPVRLIVLDYECLGSIIIARMMIQGTATPMLNRRVHIKQREEHCVLT